MHTSQSEEEYLFELYTMMRCIVKCASEDEWEKVRQLDNHRRVFLEKISRSSNKNTNYKNTQNLKMSILALDRELLELSSMALEKIKCDLSGLNKNKSKCSHYVQTQGL